MSRKWYGEYVVGEEAIDEALLALGITQEQLDRDDKYLTQLSLEESTFSGETHYQFGDETVYGNENEAIENSGEWIAEWLDNMSFQDFMSFWDNNDKKQKIASLIRCPGGNHEWLMVSSLPLIKEMGISIRYVKLFITPTSDCCFYYPHAEGGVGRHGHTGSTTMHNHLYAAIYGAYLQWKTDQTQNAESILAGRLQQFSTKFYQDGGSAEMPAALRKLIGQE